MTAAGDAVISFAYSQVGVTEQPPNSNLCSPYTDGWGAGAWCAMFVSYCNSAAGYPLPQINGPLGFSYCPDGQIYGFTYDGSNTPPEPGDCLIFSWEPFAYGPDGIAYCTSGIYAGVPAGDHTGYFVEWLGGSYMRTVEGNTSQSSWDNGGAVMERTDRYQGQICCYWRPAVMASGGGSTPQGEEDDMYKTCLVVTEGSPWKGSVFMCAGGRAVGMNDGNIVSNLQARGLAGPTIEVEEWDIYGGYEVVYPSGRGAMG